MPMLPRALEKSYSPSPLPPPSFLAAFGKQGYGGNGDPENKHDHLQPPFVFFGVGSEEMWIQNLQLFLKYITKIENRAFNGWPLVVAWVRLILYYSAAKENG